MMATAFLSAREVATRYGLTRGTVYRMAEGGTLPPGIRLGHTRRWLMSELEEWERDLRDQRAQVQKGGARHGRAFTTDD